MKILLMTALMTFVSSAALAQEGKTHMLDFGDGAASTPANLTSDNAFGESRQWVDIRRIDNLHSTTDRNTLNPGADNTHAAPIVRQFGDEDSTCVAMHSATVCN